MSVFTSRIDREKITVRKMIELYCRLNHGSKDVLCSECSYLADYADKKLTKCPFHDNKPTCKNCPIHCYQPEEKEKVRQIMRYSGPKMIFRHPYLAIMHVIDNKRSEKFEKNYPINKKAPQND